MDSALRRRFLQLLGFDLAAHDLNSELGYTMRVLGPIWWPQVRAWWLTGKW